MAIMAGKVRSRSLSEAYVNPSLQIMSTAPPGIPRSSEIRSLNPKLLMMREPKVVIPPLGMFMSSE